MDLISRQDAIDAVEQAIMYHDSAIMRITNLPSAQPDIIRCKDCKWWTKQKDSLQGRCALMQMYPTGEWFCGNAQERKEDG